MIVNSDLCLNNSFGLSHFYVIFWLVSLWVGVVVYILVIRIVCSETNRLAVSYLYLLCVFPFMSPEFSHRANQETI